VITDVPPNSIAVGVPARILPRKLRQHPVSSAPEIPAGDDVEEVRV
jgi:serine acetyltransferase